MRVGLPGGFACAVFGAQRTFLGREADSTRGMRWSDALFARTDVHSFWFASDAAGSVLELSVTGCLITDPPPCNLRAGAVDTHAQLLARSSPDVIWASVHAIADPRLLTLVGKVAASMRLFMEPAVDLIDMTFSTGAMGISPVVTRAARLHSSASRLEWATVVERANRATAELQACFRAVTSDASRCLANRQCAADWGDRVIPPAFTDITPELRASCYEANDPALALIPFPAHVVPVKSDPLAPLLPACAHPHIPVWATTWRHAILPWFYDKLLGALRQARARMRFALAHGTVDGAPRVDFLAFGPEGCAPWLARLLNQGYTVVMREGRFRILDGSRPPETHWNRAFLREVLKDSEDHALRDMVLTHGVSYLADLPPLFLVSEHLRSFAFGHMSFLHEELAEQEKFGWYSRAGSDRLDEGILELCCAPCRFQCVGQVPKGLGFRRISDSYDPRKERFTLDTGVPVLSVGEACGWDDSKRLHRHHSCAPRMLRHSPAFRRKLTAPALELRPALVASSWTPSQVAAREIAAGSSASPLAA